MPLLEAGYNNLCLCRVRLHGAADGLRARLRLEAALAGFAPSSLGLPPRALLIVKRVAPTARLRLDRPGAAEGFQQAVRVELERNARYAGRPWINPETAGTGAAVLFADASELIACLLLDWLRGGLSSCWWARAVLDGLPVPLWWRHAVLPQGELLPAVLAHLAQRGVAVTWVARLADDEAAAAVAAVEAAHARIGAGPAAAPAPSPAGRAQDAPPPLARRADIASPGSPPARALFDAWSRLAEIVPEIRADGLRLPQRRLLALALGLQRASAWVRGAEFAAAWQALEADAARGRTEFAAPAGTFVRGSDAHNRTDGMANPVTLYSPMPPDLLPPGEGEMNQSSRTGLASPAGIFAPRADSPNMSGGAANPVTHHSPRPKLFPPEAGGKHQRSRPESANLGGMVEPDADGQNLTGGLARPFTLKPLHELTPSGDKLATSDTVPAAPILPLATETPATALATAVETEFGGLFYLLNVALALGLYGDFTQPVRPGIALSPWDWLALIGRAWFGESFRRDPLWQLLAELAGRSPGESPGLGYSPPVSWSLPDAWLAPWGRIDDVQMCATRHRLRLSHPAGFIVLDTARGKGVPPLRQARDYCARQKTLRDARVLRGPRQFSPAMGRDALARWLGWLLPYLTARLGLALGMDDPALAKSRVCRHPATIHCTSTTLDVLLALETLPVELRLAGLDRDPGWVPAAGRTLAFHFQ